MAARQAHTVSCYVTRRASRFFALLRDRLLTRKLHQFYFAGFDYALAEESGEAAAREMRRRWLADFSTLPPEQARPLKDFVARDHTAFQVIGYNKGAMLFLMLRDEIGPQAFRAGIQRFWMNRQFRVAAWSDLRDAFEVAAERPLDAFFRQWLERPDAPQLTLRGAGRGDGTVDFTLMQSDPPYLLNVPVEIHTLPRGLNTMSYPWMRRRDVTHFNLPHTSRPCASIPIIVSFDGCRWMRWRRSSGASLSHQIRSP